MQAPLALNAEGQALVLVVRHLKLQVSVPHAELKADIVAVHVLLHDLGPSPVDLRERGLHIKQAVLPIDLQVLLVQWENHQDVEPLVGLGRQGCVYLEPGALHFLIVRLVQWTVFVEILWPKNVVVHDLVGDLGAGLPCTGQTCNSEEIRKDSL